MVFREVEARALEDAFHRYYPQLCAVATQVLGGDESLPRTPYRKPGCAGFCWSRCATVCVICAAVPPPTSR